jgi:ubiquinol-cytochrome c reductase cytochrome c1 subunit
MSRLRALVAVTVFATGSLAASSVLAQEGVELQAAGNNVRNTQSLQRGAKYFVNYCFGCHSAQYVRYNRLAEDLQLSENQLVENLMFTGEQPFDTLENAMRPEDAVRWFGIAPPDLTLMARSRGADYIYTFLHSFYVDDSRPTGVDNLVLPGTAMPHVLWQLQGLRRPVESEGEGGEEAMAYEQITEGTVSEDEYDLLVRDIVNFLDYIGEPVQLERQRLGIRVIAFLLVFLLIAYLLKKEIWKDVA